uniref:Angiogenin-like n=2 Tax=Paramormyrops kingsleyae TaxID=1676925 RepID=A0A3B3R1I7_9TELE|nr:angiogenin-like [Paramormyrops kingsleyae]
MYVCVTYFPMVSVGGALSGVGLMNYIKTLFARQLQLLKVTTNRKGNMASVCPVLFLILAVGWAAMPVMSEIDVQLNESRYQKFLRQHFDPNMAVKKCDSTIKSRKIFGNEDTHSCKQVNTFIAAGNKNDIKNVCDKAGSPYRGNLRISNKPFHVITCDLKGGSGRPPCEYRGHSSTRKIVIGCENKLPVHYEEGIIIPSANESV